MNELERISRRMTLRSLLGLWALSFKVFAYFDTYGCTRLGFGAHMMDKELEKRVDEYVDEVWDNVLDDIATLVAGAFCGD